ncbi:MAG: ribonuclease PH [Bdellovibrionales bacterium]|nr:ribonuclease PH [Bdellovibrionales bacterium]
MRSYQRNDEQLRPVKIVPEVILHAEGSVEVQFGNTKLICTASVEPNVPKWMQGSGEGWVSAEYGMLPRSTHTRIRRDKAANSGRSQEISRLIGRSLRSAVDLKALGERSIQIDCDVIQADGGTRTAAITGGFVALALALEFLKSQGELKEIPLKSYVSAVSLGLFEDKVLVDLDYQEDFSCGADTNFVMNNDLDFVEVQGTAEGQTISRDNLDKMTELASSACKQLFQVQQEVIGAFYPLPKSEA